MALTPTVLVSATGSDIGAKLSVIATARLGCGADSYSDRRLAQGSRPESVERKPVGRTTCVNPSRALSTGFSKSNAIGTGCTRRGCPR